MGSIRLKNQGNALTPPTGRSEIWVDSITKRLKSIDDAGVTHDYTVDGGIAEAPIDGSEYVRKDGNWSVATASGGGGTSDHSLLTKLDYVSSGHTGFEASGAAATAVSTHESTYVHGNIAHTNRVALDVVSGTNTGDETNVTIKTKLGTSSTSTNGYLTSTDWNTFNGKEPAITKLTAFNKDYSTTSTDIKINGTQSLGVLDTLPRADHIHPIDTTRAPDNSADTLERTGFVDPSLVVVTYDATTRIATLTGTVKAYWRDQVVPSLVSGYTSPAHAATTGIWFLSYNGSSVVWSTTPWTFDQIQICIVNYDGVNNFGIRECHGLMDFRVHQNLHTNIGTFLSSGGDLSSYVLASTTVADRRPDISAATLYDEDLKTINAALTSKLYTKFYLSGAGAVGNYVVETADIVPLLTNNPYYNQFTGGSWIQTLMPNNSYQAIYVIALPVSASVNSQKYRYLFVQGQTQSTTLATIQALTPSSVNLNGLNTNTQELVFIAKIIIRYTGGNWNVTSVEKITGNKSTQVNAAAGAYLSSVSTDANFTGDGTTLNPLALASAITVGTIVGGTGTTSTLTHKATSGVGTTGSDQIFQVGNNGATEAMRILNNGNVGIGTTNPQAKLYIQNGTSAGAPVWNVTDALIIDRSDYAGIQLLGSNTSYLGFSKAATRNIGSIAYDYVSNFMAFATNSTERLRIDSSGNVGIGIMAPTSRLTLNGSLARNLIKITTATYTVLVTDTYLVANYTGTVTLTLPAAASFHGREINIRTIQAQTVVSASSNVDINGTAGTAILAATIGKWVLLVSDGTNWFVQNNN
jgi:hypothetical protein